MLKKHFFFWCGGDIRLGGGVVVVFLMFLFAFSGVGSVMVLGFLKKKFTGSLLWLCLGAFYGFSKKKQTSWGVF